MAARYFVGSLKSQYERHAKDINKAAGATLYALAQTLSCQVEDLLEYGEELAKNGKAIAVSRAREFSRNGQGYLTKQELLKIVIPLSAVPETSVEDYVNFVMRHRNGQLDLSKWPNCQPGANDHRIGREFLLFLANYGYVEISNEEHEERFIYNQALDDEISEIIGFSAGLDLQQTLDRLRNTAVTDDIERIRVQKTRARPNQARFRRAVLTAYTRCIITNVTMPEVLEAAHIVPVRYHGEDTTANGFCMRMDIHLLFDAGHLRVNPDGDVELSQRARLDYGALIPPHIHIPAFVSRDFLRWRWENYNGI